MSLSGRLKTMDLPDVLQWVTIGKKTGSISFVKDKIKVSIYFRDGRIVSSRTNDPIKQLGQFLLFQGKINEADLKHALDMHLKTKTILGIILIKEHIVEQSDVEAALKMLTSEIIYDLFLWEDGNFHFSDEDYDLDDLIQIKMEVNALLFEGIRRKDEWRRIRSVFPNNDTVPTLRPGVDLKAAKLTHLQKKLAYLLTLKKSISEIMLELHGSDFLVNFELFQLYEKNVVDVMIPAVSKAEEVNPAKMFNEGLELMTKEKFQEALELFQEVIRLEPQNSWASEQIEKAEKAVCQQLYKTTLPPEKTPYFLIPESSLLQYKLSHEEGFIASRINGSWDIKSIVMLSPMREIDILRVLDKLFCMELIGLR